MRTLGSAPVNLLHVCPALKGSHDKQPAAGLRLHRDSHGVVSQFAYRVSDVLANGSIELGTIERGSLDHRRNDRLNHPDDVAGDACCLVRTDLAALTATRPSWSMTTMSGTSSTPIATSRLPIAAAYSVLPALRTINS